jgi:predicted enzyme related to lactoylglutathione lyase
VLVVLYSDDLVKSQIAIESAGGKIKIPTFEFPGGRRFHFSDGNDNEYAMWSDK